MLLRLSTSFILLVGLTLPSARAAEAPRNEQPKIPVEQIIDSFVKKETEFATARESYTYRQTVKMTEYNEANRPAGSWELVQDVIFGPNRERSERVVYAPVPSLRLIQLTPQDEQDLRDVQPFVMTTQNRDEYDIAYMGTETIDEIACYVFSVKPIALEKGERYFQGQIWVDQRDLQIVKTYGKGVGRLKKNEDNQFPAFETYRNQIDGKYWFPVYTRADDVLHFRNGDIRVKMVIKYEKYKRYGAESQITFGEAVEDPNPTTEPPTAPPPAVPNPK
ncbi:MAG: hypothetical protein GC160_02650 [Acidobacteria bacterium]|nr:hypothetical protein [Acidobacteriota bacterium]